jgi:hypothetical protein
MQKSFFILLIIKTLCLSTTCAQVGIGTTTPDASSILELESTEKGFLPPRMTSAQRDAIINPAEGLTIINTSTKCLQIYNGSHWFDACQVAADVPRVVGANGHIWMDRNLGASRVATSFNDAQAYGDMYQWGRAADGHEKRISTNYDTVLSTDGVAGFDNDPANAWHGQFIVRNSGANNWVDPTVTNGTITSNDLWQGVIGTNNPCPMGYRVPTSAELNAERSSWSSQDRIGAFASPLKLPSGGRRRRTDGNILFDGTYGYYWSSTISGTNAILLRFLDSSTSTVLSPRAESHSVRCIKN